MTRQRGQQLGLGLLLVGLLFWHALGKLAPGLLAEMFWVCHLATALCAAGLLLDRPALSTTGGLFHVAAGLPGWLLELALHGTTFSSTLLHITTPLAGLWSARRWGVPKWIILGAFGIWGLGLISGRLCDPALNINMAWRAYDVWPSDTPLWVYQSCNALLLASLTGIVQQGLGWIWKERA